MAQLLRPLQLCAGARRRGRSQKAHTPLPTALLLRLLLLCWEPRTPDGQAHLPATEFHCFAALARQLPSSSTEL